MSRAGANPPADKTRDNWSRILRSKVSNEVVSNSPRPTFMLIAFRQPGHTWCSRHAEQNGFVRPLRTFVIADADSLVQANARVIHPRAGNALNSQLFKSLPVFCCHYAVY